jgi:hypothetical protein
LTNWSLSGYTVSIVAGNSITKGRYSMSHADPSVQGTPPESAGTPGHSSTPTPTPELFPPAELAAFHAEDKAAGTHIVGLMLSIFVLGLLGYLFVCLWVGGAVWS